MAIDRPSDQRPTPYVGVSGVVGLAQEATLDQFAEQAGLYGLGRNLALGVKATDKTQGQDLPSRYGPDWFPVGEKPFRDALAPWDGWTHRFGVVQAYLEPTKVGDRAYRDQFVSRLVERGGPWIRAIQFDLLPWYRGHVVLDFLIEVKRTHGLPVWLQCQGPAMAELGPAGLAGKLSLYGGAVDRLLFDASHATGTELDPAALRPFLAAAYAAPRLAHVGMGIAGGLDAVTVRQHLPSLLRDFPDLSWDAEGRLHGTAGSRGPLDMAAVRAYLQASSEVLAA